jgi:hypothetical protein
LAAWLRGGSAPRSFSYQMGALRTMRAYQNGDYQLAQEPSDRRLRSVEIEESLQRLGWLMDDLIRIPILGWRIGLDAIVGLVPGLGDTATSLVSFYILASAVRYRVPKVTLLRMGMNIAIDYLLGSLPVVGDLLDAWWKSNQMNVELLRRRATVSANEARKGRLSDWLFVGSIILLLAGLALGAAFLSIYLLILVVGQLTKTS